ncbi:MAG TPA: T9SS type A sorting domain-containing protein [Saprospiraceae bacterium]|nr:T9SS type A sorting domain-containing protein [Saprospiraceae bacterium]
MRLIWVLLVFLLLGFQASGQSFPSYTGLITIKAFPQNKQICTRQKGTNTAKVLIAGTVASSSNYDQIKLSVSVDSLGTFVDTFFSLSYEGDSANFQLEYDLEANLLNHQFILTGVQGSTEVAEWIATDVVAGDIYIINGQSNAQAFLSAKPEDVVEFTRSYFNDQWNDLGHSFPGQWGAHLAKVMSENLGYPIGIFNFADGAQPISYFQKNVENPAAGNYGGMLSRLDAAGVDAPLAVFWFHGEANGWDTSTETYYNSFDTLRQSWKDDFGIEGAFLYQVRRLGCAHPNPYIFEAQRLLAEQIPDIHIMSTTNADQDSCHYRWEDGYRVLAERMAQVVKAKLYGQVIDNQDFAPNIDKIERFNNTTLKMTFKPSGVPLNIIGAPAMDFRHEESGHAPSIVWADGDTLVVQFDSIVNVGEHFSYLSHPGPTADWVVTSSGVGILEFYNQPIVDYMVGLSSSLTQKTNLLMSPNPTDNSCFIQWNEPEIGEIKVFDPLGRPVVAKVKKIMDSGFYLDLSFLPQGLYQVIVQSEKTVGVGRIVKW